MIQARICILYLAATGGLAFAQSYAGSITSAGCGSFQGAASFNGAITGVDLYSDGVYLGTTTSGPNASGALAWSFAFPPSLMDNQVHHIYAMFSGATNYEGAPVPLTNSPTSVECSPGSSGYQYTYSDSFTSIIPATGPQTAQFRRILGAAFTLAQVQT